MHHEDHEDQGTLEQFGIPTPKSPRQLSNLDNALIGCGFPRRHVENQSPNENGRLSKWASACSYLRSRMDRGSIFVIVGPRGTGKTQMATKVALASAVANQTAIDVRPSMLYTTAHELAMAIKSTWEKGSMTEREAIRTFTNPRLLVIDEVHERGKSEWEQRMLTTIVDTRYRCGYKDTILIGNMKPETLNDELGASIMSRVSETGGIILADWPSFR